MSQRLRSELSSIFYLIFFVYFGQPVHETVVLRKENSLLVHESF